MNAEQAAVQRAKLENISRTTFGQHLEYVGYGKVGAPYLTDDNGSCLPVAFALAMEIDIAEFLDDFGSRPYEVEPGCEEMPPPLNLRGFAPEDVIRAAWDRGWATTVFQSNYDVIKQHPISGYEQNVMHHNAVPISRRCVIGYLTPFGGHAVAIRGNVLHDPAAGMYKFNPAAKEFPFHVAYTMLLTEIGELSERQVWYQRDPYANDELPIIL